MYEELRKFIEDNCIFRTPPGYYLKGIPEGKMYSSQFYLRRAIFDQKMIGYICDWLLRHHDGRFQYAAMETAGPPMLAALMAYANTKKIKIEGFAIRKERKKYGLFNWVEGRFDPEKPCIILDDMANSKSTIMRAKAVCEEMGLKVEAAKTIVNKSFDKDDVNGLKLYSMFSVNQFKLRWDDYGKCGDVQQFIDTYRGVLFKQTGPDTCVKL